MVNVAIQKNITCDYTCPFFDDISCDEKLLLNLSNRKLKMLQLKKLYE